VGVRDPEVRQLLEENPPLGIAGPQERAVRAQHLAKQLAVLKGMAECDARKVFTFHGRIKAARAFTLASTPEGIHHVLDSLPVYRDRLPGFQAAHVNGTQSTADRVAILQEALSAPYALVSNAGCLTEGVDTPAVDAVAFIDPRESLSAIVQATGRALRKAEQKPVGFIIIPVFLGEADDPDQIAESSQFRTVYRVVRAMADQDERLEERLRLARREMTLGGSRPADSGPIVTIGIKTSYADFDRAIYLRIVERTAPNWEYMFALLEIYKAEHGHVRVPQDLIFHGEPLGSWLGTQRQFKKKGRLSEERIRQLETLGIDWEPFEKQWWQMHALYKEYKQERGHVAVPEAEVFRGMRLGHWLFKQRQLKKRGKLSPDRVHLLEALGIQWRPVDAQWEETFNLLETYKAMHGHVRIPIDQDFQGKPLGKWLNAQRLLKRRGQLTADRVRRLEALGIEWDPKVADWEDKYALAKAYGAERGHVSVEAKEMYRGQLLGSWLTTQRRFRRLGKLSENHIKRLEDLGVEWNPRDALWEKGYALLVAFRAEKGNVLVQKDETFRGMKLGAWVDNQRQKRKRRKLSAGRVEGLEALGVEWEPLQAQWEKTYSLLPAFKAERGHVQVRQDEVFCGEQLGRWLHKQRQLKKHGKLSADRIVRLETIGVEWDPPATRRELMYSLLAAYQAEHGHVDVPQAEIFRGEKLGRWLANQRHRKRTRLDTEWIKRLEVLGVKLNPNLRIS